MLSPPDLSGFDLAALAGGLEAAALRQDRCRRLANSIGVDEATNPETARAVAAVDADAAATAEAHRLVCLLRRFASDEGHARPRAPVAHLRVVPAPAPPRPGIFARAMAILGRGDPSPSPVAKRDAA